VTRCGTTPVVPMSRAGGQLNFPDLPVSCVFCLPANKYPLPVERNGGIGRSRQNLGSEDASARVLKKLIALELNRSRARIHASASYRWQRCTGAEANPKEEATRNRYGQILLPSQKQPSMMERPH